MSETYVMTKEKDKNVEEFAKKVRDLAEKYGLDFCLVIEGGKFTCSALTDDKSVRKAIMDYNTPEVEVPKKPVRTFSDLYHHLVYDLEYQCGTGDIYYIPIKPEEISVYPKWYIMMNENKSKLGLAMKQDPTSSIYTACEFVFNFSEFNPLVPSKCTIISYISRGTKKGIIRAVGSVTNVKYFDVDFSDINHLDNEFYELFGNNCIAVRDVILEMFYVENHATETKDV